MLPSIAAVLSCCPDPLVLDIAGLTLQQATVAIGLVKELLYTEGVFDQRGAQPAFPCTALLSCTTYDVAVAEDLE